MSSEDDSSWFAEPPFSGFQQRFQIRSRLFRHMSPYQTIEIYDTVPFGRMLVLNGAAQTTEKDEFIYHEMLSLVPMLTHANPRRVAVIGGGDGGTLRRVLCFPTVQEVWQVELDQAVTDACQQYLAAISAGAFSDERVRLHFGDGARFLRDKTEWFDVILIDSTDPIGPAEALFSASFYEDVQRALTSDGVMATQSGSPLLMAGELRRAVHNIEAAFGLVRPYLASVPSYPGVLWSFTLASKGRDPLRISRAAAARRLRAASIQPLYYNLDVHFASFALPSFLTSYLEHGRTVELVHG